MKEKNRTKLFLENFLIYGIGGMISKFIPMIMLPILTRLYPSSEYLGLNDLSTTFISFASALAVCGMYDAMFRLFFDDDTLKGQKKVCSTAMGFVLIMTVLLGTLVIIFRRTVAGLYFRDEKYEGLVVLTVIGFMLSSTNQIISAPTRIQNKRKVFLVTNTVSPIISYMIAIPLVMAGHYILAMPLAMAVSSLTLEISFGIMNRRYFSFASFDSERLKDLLKIGLPLLPNFLIYWIYNSADKVMISHMLGTDFTGVYAVASRIGHISNLIYNAFAGGWLYFAYSTMNDDDQVQMKSNVFEYLGAISFAATAMLMAVSRLGFELLFPPEYHAGYLVAPYLFLSPLMLMLYQVIANQFTIVKKTYMNLLTLTVGAAVNVALNWILIRAIGIEGASIATVTGYAISVSVCLFWLRRMKLIVINPRAAINAAVMLVYFLCWRLILHATIIGSILGALAVIAYFYAMYRKELAAVVSKRRQKNDL